ncbi:MAG: hypothetical protein JSU63_10410 [Phycisphaerales bacterium]|nr:MAG: hypothetical protein JSU63_10410 [Phycisphaerales bacterium]
MAKFSRVLTAACVLALSGVSPGGERPDRAASAAALDELQARYPGVRATLEGARVRSLYGRILATGATPMAAAERVRTADAAVFGVKADELEPGLYSRGNRRTQPLMYDRDTGTYRFTLVYYSQIRDGVPVFRSDLRVLVRNQADYPVVLVKSSLHDLGDLDVAGRSASVGPAAARDGVMSASPELQRYAQQELVVWAGVDDMVVEPRLAYTFIGQSDFPERWLFVADAETGEVLYRESLIQTEDVVGNVSGRATQGAVAEQCAPELDRPMRHAHVNIGGTIAYTDVSGDFVIPNAGTDEVTVDSPIRGEWFTVYHYTGTDEVLSQAVTPPGPAGFLHNQANTEFVRAQVNAYVFANDVRDYVLRFNPSYPTLDQTGFPVYVNRTDGYCPGNAWYSYDVSLNFCSASSPYPNTAFASVVQHEYGHHLVSAAGSGQDQYGEGMGDVMSILLADDPGLGYGFTGTCTVPLRTADNTMQYPCTGEAHACAGLLSGAVWDTRNELVITERDYMDILSNLAINAMLLHTGSLTTPQIAIDYLTLDDDDADLDNGTPHYSEICAGFGAHNLDCPALVLVQFEYPEGLPETISPEQAYTLRVNVLPNVANPTPDSAMINYRVGEEAFTAVPMTEIAANEYEATLPASSCTETIDYYFSVVVDFSGGTDVTDPPGSPTSTFASVVATEVIEVAAYDFESSTGWTVSGDASDGQWGTGIPVDPDRGGPPSDYDGSGRCYLTDNVTGNSDVDDGTTILTSPTFDLSDMISPRVSYARWYSNVAGDSPMADTFLVRVSDDGGINWATLETVGPSGDEVLGGWYEKTFDIADYVTLTDQVVVRFEASDLGSGSIVEAAVDAFSITDVLCGLQVPAPAPAPHDTRKHRYVSFAPTNYPTIVAYRVELTQSEEFPDSAGVLGWVGQPDVNDVSRFEDAPYYAADWPSVVHLGDCEVIPLATYRVSATTDAVVFSEPLDVSTIHRPGVWFYGDVVGDSTGDLPPLQGFTGPNGVVNVTDVQAYQLTAQGPMSPSAETTWIDLHGLGDGSPPNFMLNISDLQQILLGLEGAEYGNGAEHPDPADCP